MNVRVFVTNFDAFINIILPANWFMYVILTSEQKKWISQLTHCFGHCTNNCFQLFLENVSTLGESKDVTSEGDGTTIPKGEFIVYLYSTNLDVC